MSEIHHDDVRQFSRDYMALSPQQRRAVDRCVQALNMGASVEVAKRVFWREINRENCRHLQTADGVLDNTGTASVVEFPS